MQWSKLSLGGLLSGFVLLLNVLAAAPHLHEWFHADAGQARHQCAVTLFADGHLTLAAGPVVCPLPGACAAFSVPPPVFVCLSVFDNLPPGRGPPLASFPS